MIWEVNPHANHNSQIESTIKNLEKAKALLDERYKKGSISDKDYIEKSRSLDDQIKKYKNLLENQ
jgi:uncharacterized membrane protein